jgi:hypothetical protein
MAPVKRNVLHSSSMAWAWNAVTTSRANRGRLDIRVRHLVVLILGDLQEGLPSEVLVEKYHANVRVQPVCAHHHNPCQRPDVVQSN